MKAEIIIHMHGDMCSRAVGSSSGELPSAVVGGVDSQA